MDHTEHRKVQDDLSYGLSVAAGLIVLDTARGLVAVGSK
jgi:hypothetical protein